jgi:hypothetical protein
VEPAHLDAWLPAPAIRTRHRATAAADMDALWGAAANVRLDETRSIGRLVQWRIPGTPGEQTFRDLLSRYPFTVLSAGEHWLLSGMCGRIWTLARDYPVLASADDFRRWDARGTARVLFAHWTEPAGAGRSALVSEARVEPVDRRAELALRSLWLAIGGFERLIGAEPVRLATRRAEAPAR